MAGGTTKKMECITAFVWVDGARPPVYQKRIVRDRHSGKLVEVDMNPELPPLDPGSEGVTHVVALGKVLSASHPAVRAKPMYFEPVEK